MIKDYGMLAGNSKRKAPFQQDKDDHIMRLKRVPMSLAQKTNSIWEPLLDLAECGNMNCKSDLQVNKSIEA